MFEDVYGNHLCSSHLSVRLDAVLQAVELPASIADLATGLANVDGDRFPHGGVERWWGAKGL